MFLTPAITPRPGPVDPLLLFGCSVDAVTDDFCCGGESGISGAFGDLRERKEVVSVGTGRSIRDLWVKVGLCCNVAASTGDGVGPSRIWVESLPWSGYGDFTANGALALSSSSTVVIVV